MKSAFICAVAATTSAFSLGAFAQSSGEPVDPNVFVNQFESTFGKFEGYRRSGAKGICATGEFVGTADARSLSSSTAFSGKPVPVVVRFSIGGANPKAPDNGKSQRNLALQFNLPRGETWQMGNISSPIFSASTPQQFLGRLVSLQPDPETKMADPAKVKAFAEANPEVLMQGKYFASQPVPASFGAVNYWGVHAFGFVKNKAKGKGKDKAQFGKWLFEPVGGVQGLTDEEAKEKGTTFLFEELRQRVKDGNVGFNFNLELAEEGDKIDSATVPLPEGRKKVNMGLLKITSVSPDGDGDCLKITYNPMVLPKGVIPSADPMIAARAAPYGVSLGRRLSEGAKQ